MIRWILHTFHLLKDSNLYLLTCSNMTSPKEGQNLQRGLRYTKLGFVWKKKVLFFVEIALVSNFSICCTTADRLLHLNLHNYQVITLGIHWLQKQYRMWTKMFLLQEVNKIDAYKETKLDPQEIVDRFKKRYLVLRISLNCWFWRIVIGFLLISLLLLLHLYSAVSTVSVGLTFSKT